MGFFMRNNWDITSFSVITQAEIESSFESVVERLDRGGGPFLILMGEKPSLILMSWEDYWDRFGVLHPEGERSQIEDACRKSCKI